MRTTRSSAASTGRDWQHSSSHQRCQVRRVRRRPYGTPACRAVRWFRRARTKHDHGSPDSRRLPRAPGAGRPVKDPASRRVSIGGNPGIATAVFSRAPGDPVRAAPCRLRAVHIRGRHLFSGAMSLEDCDPVRELLAAGVSRSVSPNDDVAVSEPPTAEPLLDCHRLGADGSADHAGSPWICTRRGSAPSAPYGQPDNVSAQRSHLCAVGRRQVIRHAPSARSAARIGRPPGWVIVEFPAWRYETGEQLWAAMAKATYDAALDPTRLNWYERLMFPRSVSSSGGARRCVWSSGRS